MDAPRLSVTDGKFQLSSYPCDWCAKEIKKVQMKEGQKIYCLACLEQFSQPFVSAEDPYKLNFKAMKIHSPKKTLISKPVKKLQEIPDSFFLDLEHLPINEGIIKVKALLENKFLLCATEETEMYALTKRSSGGWGAETWSYGLIVRSKHPETIAVCFNPTTKAGKCVPRENVLAISSALMDSINHSMFTNSIDDVNMLEKSFSLKYLATQMIQWAKAEDHA